LQEVDLEDFVGEKFCKPHALADGKKNKLNKNQK